jgi:hypothetical protein
LTIWKANSGADRSRPHLRDRPISTRRASPQAGRLVEGLPAKVVVADTAYDADHFG